MANMMTFANNINFITKDFSDLMTQWTDLLSSSTFKALDATGSDSNSFSSMGSSSGIQTLEKPKKESKKSSNKSSSNTSNKSSKRSSSSSSSSQMESRDKDKSFGKSSKKSKKTKIKKPLRKNKKLLPTFEVIGNVSNDITMDLQHGNEGFDLHISQNVCDDSRPVAGKEAESYFLMRHSFQYPGPWMTMMQGPQAAMNGGGAYRVSAEAVHKDKYVLVGTYNSNTVEGVWEQTWNSNIKSQVTFIAGFLSAQQRQMQMMMGGGGPKFPSLVAYTDIKYPNWASKIRLDMMNNELSVSLNRRITDNIMIGSRIATCYDARKTLLEFGARYQWFTGGKSSTSSTSDNSSNNNNSNKNISNINNKNAIKNTIELLFNKESLMTQLFYSRSITDNAQLTSRLMWSLGSMDRLMTSVGYKYQFGRHPGVSKMICGEISSDGCVRQSLTFPLLTNMLVKFYGEMHHFLSPESMQRGQFPHKFGISLNVHL